MISRLSQRVRYSTRHLKFLLQRSVAEWETKRLLQDIQDNLEYQQWLEQELVNAKFNRSEMLAKLVGGE